MRKVGLHIDVVVVTDSWLTILLPPRLHHHQQQQQSLLLFPSQVLPRFPPVPQSVPVIRSIPRPFPPLLPHLGGRSRIHSVPVPVDRSRQFLCKSPTQFVHPSLSLTATNLHRSAARRSPPFSKACRKWAIESRKVSFFGAIAI